jgi:DNA-binding NarL/FixJ family response regulator
MKTNSQEVLIISRSVALQQGLSALLESLPSITVVTGIKEMSSINAWIESHRPRIVMLDMTFGRNELLATLETVKTLSPQTQRLLLVDQVSEVCWVPQYAEAILIKGAPASAVVTIVSNLLLAKGEEDEHNDSDQ